MLQFRPCPHAANRLAWQRAMLALSALLTLGIPGWLAGAESAAAILTTTTPPTMIAAGTPGGALRRDDGDGHADLAPWIGGHPVMSLRLNDIPRSRARFAQSPYADLGTTAWGRELAQKFLGRLSFGPAQVGSVTQGLRAVALGVDGGPAAPGVSWAASTTNTDALCHWYEQAFASCGTLQVHGSVITCGSLAIPAPIPPMVAASARFPEACLELRLDPGRALSALGLPGVVPDLDQSSPHPLAVALSLDAIGVREHWDIAIKQSARWQALTLPSAHVDLLRALPADTVMACTLNCDANSMISGLLATGVSDRPVVLLAVDVLLARAGLPPLVDLLHGMHGDCVAWVSAGTGAPGWTVVAGMDPGLAIPLVSMVVNDLGLTSGAPGVYVGFLGGSPFQISFQEGRLLVTTQACGVQGCLEQPAGFATHPEVSAALAELPRQAVLLGVSRSGCAMDLLGQLGLAAVTRGGLPELSTLPHDLALRARHGFISVRQTPSGLSLDAGGMLGGPLTTYAALGSAAFATYLAMLHAGASATPAHALPALDSRGRQSASRSL